MPLLGSYTINIFWHFLKIFIINWNIHMFLLISTSKIAILIVSINFSIEMKNLSFGWPMVKITYIEPTRLFWPTWLFYFRKQTTLHDYSIVHVYSRLQSMYILNIYIYIYTLSPNTKWTILYSLYAKTIRDSDLILKIIEA